MSKSSERAERMQKAAAQLAAQKAREKRRNLLMILGVVAAMVVIVGGGALIASMNNNAPQVPTGGALSGGGSSSIGVTVGPAGAPHQVVIYEDFICPFCGMFEQASHAELASLAAAGKVQISYRPFHFLPEDYSEQALEVFEAVKAQGNTTVTKAFHDELYTSANQPSEAGPYPSQSDIVALAVKAGADQGAIQKALSDGSAKTAAKDATTDAGTAHVQATPTILLDGKEFVDGTTVQQLAANLIKTLS